jgi:putative spermidine/putrescine transport system substrate-binding protein
MKKKWLWLIPVAALAVLWLVGRPSQAQTAQPVLPPSLNTPYIRELAAKARAEGGVIYTYGMPSNWANYGHIFAEFQRLFGIRQEDIDMGSSEVLARMTAEHASKNDVADLAPDFARKLAEEGLTMPYKVTSWNAIPAGAKGVGKDGSVWYEAYKGTIGWLVNPQIVKTIPRTWTALENPAYKGLIEYLDPRVTGTGVATVMSAAYALTGDPYNYKAGVDFFAKLRKLGVVGAVDTNVTTSNFERGETGILINYDYNLLYWQQHLPFKTVLVIPEDGTLSTGGSVIAARNDPHPYTAKLFLEFILSKYGQSLYAQAFVTPIRPDVRFPPSVADKFPPRSAYAKALLLGHVSQSFVEALQKYYSDKVQ